MPESREIVPPIRGVKTSSDNIYQYVRNDELDKDNPFLTNEYGIIFKDPQTLIDTDWLASGAITTSKELGIEYANRRYATLSTRMLGNTVLGNARSINPLPQFSRYTDYRRSSNAPGFEQDVTLAGVEDKNKLGVGAYYSEAISRNEQILYLNAGVPKFASILSVLANSVDYNEILLVGEGKVRYAEEVGEAIGTVAALWFFPVPWLIGLAIKGVVGATLGQSDTDFYHLDPKMHDYWATVGSILTEMAVELGVLSIDIGQVKEKEIGVAFTLDAESFKLLGKEYPNIISFENGSGFIDMHKLASSAFMHQTLSVKAMQNLEANLANAEGADKERYAAMLNQYITDVSPRKQIEARKTIPKFTELYSETVITAIKKANGTGDNARKAKTDTETSEGDDEYERLNPNGSKKLPIGESQESLANSIKSITGYATLSAAGAARYLPLTVEHVGSSTATFTNSVGPITMETFFNGKRQAVHDARFSTAGGNLFGGIVDTALNGVGQVLANAASTATLGLSNIIYGAWLGAAFTLPQKWEDSSVTLPTHTFKLHMMAVSGHPMCQLTTNYLTIASLLAMTLPRSTGQHTYGSPFLVSGFLRGVCNLKLAMIESLSITSSSGNLARTTEGRPLGFEVEFTLVDLSPKPVAPTPKPTKLPIPVNLDDSAALSNYIRTLAGTSLYRERTLFPRASSRLSRISMSLSAFKSNAYLGSAIHDVASSIVPLQLDAVEKQLQNDIG